MLKLFIKTIIISIILIFIITPLILLIFGLQSKPRVEDKEKLEQNDVARIRQLLKQNDPRILQPGQLKHVSFTERDINLFVDYGLKQTRYGHRLRARVDFNDRSAEIRMTATLPDNPFGKYLNVSIALSESSEFMTAKKVKIGSLTFPGWSVKLVIRAGNHLFKNDRTYQEIIEDIESINDIQFRKEQLAFTYLWNSEFMKRLQTQGKEIMLPAVDEDRLIAYQILISTLSHTTQEHRVSLTRFISPLFKLAQERSAGNNNPVAENQALILALSVYSVGRNIETFIGSINNSGYRSPRQIKLTLHNRTDLTKHFMISAAIAVSGGSGLANQTGIFKEIDDSRGGSGFSFADLAADRAGVKFAEKATASFQSAKQLQRDMNSFIREEDYMPAISNLPEGIMELEFKYKYKNLESSAYKIVEQEIASRIAKCRVYR